MAAMPLAVGFAIASGVTPAQGLWTAINAGVLLSALGGSEAQIARPTGAFVLILSWIVATREFSGLTPATVTAGLFLMLRGAMTFGTIIKFDARSSSDLPAASRQSSSAASSSSFSVCS